jgi:putative hydrolase of the HAD superfamily
MARGPQVLLIDADDTLWETNLRFRRTLDAFCGLVSPLGYSEEYVRREVDAAERARIPRGGYGEQKFLHTLEEVYLKLAGTYPDRKVVEEIARLARHLHGAPPRLLDGVLETLTYLAPRHRLFLFSKGDSNEQAHKVKASGLERFFAGWEIVPEKDAAAYRDLVERDGWKPEDVWMVGDSPRSDINPALSMGLNAVYIPAAQPWEYEEEEIRPGQGQLLILNSFRDLQNHF